nr:putative disease resistance protein RGA4 [Populus alba]
MAEGVLFNIAEEIIKTLGSLTAQEVALWWGLKDQLRKLNDTVTRIKAVIQDAEEQAQKQNHQIEVIWLMKLREAVYDAEDLLDDFSTQVVRKQLMPGKRVSREVRLFFSRSNQFVYGLRMGHRVKALRERLDNIETDSKIFHFEVRDEERASSTTAREQTTSSEPEKIVGRESDKEAVKNFLMNSNKDENVSVISVVGMGGLGKTTLAQHVFNDERVKANFGVRLWVSVSGSLDVRKIIKGAVGTRDFDDQLKSLKKEFEEKIGKQKYLLVLDDVWDGEDGLDGEKWDRLKELLPRDAVGSKIVVTTRSHVIAKFTSTIEPHVLKGLSVDESWDLFRRKAFPQGQEWGHVHERIRKEIVERCCGVPLVIKAIARLTSLKDRAQWLSFILDELPDSIRDDNIIQTLKLSYDALPSFMKHCFAYCSLFPKGHKIDVKYLIRLWIAQGFVSSSNSGRRFIEIVGLKCFESLLWRSFFHEVKKDRFGNIESCKMHDFMHDLATHVAGFQSIKVERGGNRISELTRHVSFDTELDLSLPSAQRLRTLVLLQGGKWDEGAWESICRDFRRLRVLVLSDFGMEEVSSLIEKLKHLKYLDLSNNEMEALPNSITTLVNLQVLKLNGCKKLKELPRDIGKLINLRHLDVGSYLDDDLCENLEYMPRGIGKLTSLQTLSCFVAAKNRSSKSVMIGGLDELSRLNELRGRLEIRVKGYDSGSCVSEFEGAKLKDKQYLHSLTIKWDIDSDSDIYLYDEMLPSLQPNSILQELVVAGYGGMRFPGWVSHLSNLARIRLERCRRLEHIPPLHGIPSLDELSIADMDSLEYIDSEGDGGRGVSMFFPSLKKLRIFDCPSLKGWWKNCRDEMNDDSEESTKEEELIILCFPCLSSLSIVYCPNLTSMPLFPTLDESLHLWETSSMPLQETMKMKSPVFSSSSSSSSSSFIRPLSKLKNLDIGAIRDMESLPEVGLQNLSSLQQLFIYECPSLKSLPLHDKGMHSLQILCIKSCSQLKSLSEESQGMTLSEYESQGMIPFLPSLQVLRIDDCNEELSGRTRGWGRESEEWPKIKHILNIVIDGYYIQEEGRYAIIKLEMNVRYKLQVMSLEFRGGSYRCSSSNIKADKPSFKSRDQKSKFHDQMFGELLIFCLTFSFCPPSRNLFGEGTVAGTGVGLGLDKAEKVQRMEQAGSVYGKAEKVIDVALIVDDGTGWIRKWFCVLTEKFSSSYTRLSIRTPLRLTTSGNVNGWTEVQTVRLPITQAINLRKRSSFSSSLAPTGCYFSKESAILFPFNKLQSFCFVLIILVPSTQPPLAVQVVSNLPKLIEGLKLMAKSTPMVDCTGPDLSLSHVSPMAPVSPDVALSSAGSPTSGVVARTYSMVLRPRSSKTANLTVLSASRSTFLPQQEPVSFKVADKYLIWHKAMQEELRALHSNDTWSLVPFAPSMNMVGSRWVYKIKRRVDGCVDRYKARLVARGFTQQEGVDYLETFSLEEVYMAQPPGFVDPTFPSYASKVDTSLFILSFSGAIFYLLVYVDDILLTGRKQRTMARSSTEAEYKALADGTAEILWIRSLLSELHFPSSSMTTLWCDNLGATFLSLNPVFHAHTKHVEVNYHFVRDRVAKQEIQERLPFKYIGLPIGASSCRTLMWKPILHNISARLQDIVKHQSVMLVGNGKRIKFWLDDWTTTGRLAYQFPSLFQLSNDKEASLDKMGIWDGHAWFWLFNWTRPLRGRNYGLLDQMNAILSKVHPNKDAEDRLVWKANSTGRFSVKSLCGLLSPNPPMDTSFSFIGIWRGIVPPKVEIFY